MRAEASIVFAFEPMISDLVRQVGKAWERTVIYRVFPPNHGRYQMAKTSNDIVDDTSEQSSRVASYADRAVEGAKEYASEAADRVSSLAKEAYDNPQRFVRQTQRDITRQTQQSPLQTLAIAAGIGFVIGAIWKR